MDQINEYNSANGLEEKELYVYSSYETVNFVNTIQLVKGVLGCFVEQNIRFVFSQELFRVSGFAIRYIDITGFRIIDDVSTQHSDLGHAFFGCLYLIGKSVIVFRRFCCAGIQVCILQQPVFGQIIHSLGHLLEIEHLSPAGVSGTFPSLEFCLNVHQQIDPGRGGLRDGLLAGRMLFLAEKKKAYGEYRKAREEMRELQTVKANVDRVMGFEDEKRVEKERDQEQKR